MPVSVVDPLHQSVLSSIDEALATSETAEKKYNHVSGIVAQDCTSLSREEAIVYGFNTLLAKSTALSVNGGSTVVRLSDDITVKIAYGLDADHLEILRSLQHHAAASFVPKPLGFLRTTHLSYCFQSLIEGVPLDSVWADLNEMHKLSVQGQLESIFNGIRTISWAETLEALGSGFPRRCKDMRRHLRVADHEIRDEVDFQQFVTEVDADAYTADLLQRRDMIRSMLRPGHSIVLTHADLHPRNIIVKWMKSESTHALSETDVVGSKPRLEVKGIIDWEFAGWYPAYWEYVKALHTISARDSTLDWWKYLPPSVGTWGGEFAVDLMISRWLH